MRNLERCHILIHRSSDLLSEFRLLQLIVEHGTGLSVLAAKVYKIALAKTANQSNAGLELLGNIVGYFLLIELQRMFTDWRVLFSQQKNDREFKLWKR